MKGIRVEWDSQILNPGEYSKAPSGWFGCSPTGHMANLEKHSVEEHPDGTITVFPSILISNKNGPLWHGYLKNGEWIEC